MVKIALAILLLLLAGSARSETISLGLGFDKAREGHGYDLHKVGDSYILFFYTYDELGDPEWLLGVGEMKEGVISGRLDRYLYQADGDPRQVLDPEFDGAFSLDWRPAAIEAACNDGFDRGGVTEPASFYWRTNEHSGSWCTQFLFGGDPENSAYHGGVWYAGEDDAGYGFSMSQQGETEIAIVYYYDSEGQPRWVLGGRDDGPSIELNHYQGYCRTCNLQERILQPAGTLDLDWDAAAEPGSGSDQAQLILSYPITPFGDFDRNFALSRLSDGAPTGETILSEVTGQEFYDTFISDFIVQFRCINCHVEGGRSGHTRVVFKRREAEDHLTHNLAQIVNIADVEGADYPLNKIRGALGHGGGIQVPAETQEYQDMRLLFGLLEKDVNPSSNGTLFNNIALLPWDLTLRRAALIFAGRLPTEPELAIARGGDESAFRATVRNLMQGDAFHQFLIEGANDRMLTDKWLEDNFVNAAFSPYYPEYNRLIVETIDLVTSLPEDQRYEAWERVSGVLRRASAREPLELIAHVVENDKPYTEVVTADYTMVNPLLSIAYQSGTLFDNPEDHHEWKPGHNNGQILIDATLRFDSVPNQYIRYLSGGIPLELPHAGVLNSPAFLARYPSTATNRNRARSRWAYYFFLGVNIEKLAARSRDPDALADRDNPTMNNPACTVCHVVMDPVAGAFQNYGDEGRYRDQFGGQDSLPETYKFNPESGYRIGDSWYRDMREPGFGAEEAPDSENSIQWLGQQIATDPRFASASVRFWWPAVFGRQPLEAPEASTDDDFNARLLAFESQNQYIDEVAEGFAEGSATGGPFNLKDMLVELVMGPWFRASGLDGPVPDSQMLALEVGYVSAERLLTPEQLERKTRSITGQVWEQYEDVLGDLRSGFRDHYRMYYGGIDSDGINRRSAEITSVMSNVVAAFAAQMACPLVVKEFTQPDASRHLFAGISHLDSPILEAMQQSEVTANSFDSRQIFTTTASIQPGDKQIRIDFLNDFATQADGDRNLYATDITVSDSAGQPLESFDLSQLTGIEGATWTEGCNAEVSQAWGFFCSGYLSVPLMIEKSGEITVTVTAYGDQAGPDTIQMLTAILDNDPYGSSAGANRIRDRLVQWHELFFGETVEADGPDVTQAYELLVDTWQRYRVSTESWLDGDIQSCALWDYELSDEQGRMLWTDSQKMLGAWRLLLAYFLTDYRYIFE